MNATTDLGGTPTPLSPDDFSTVPRPASPLAQPVSTASTAEFTEADRTTLRYALNLLKAARADIKDSRTAAAGKRQMQVLISYLMGFSDSHGMTEPAPLAPGFEVIFGTDSRPDLDTTLDELEMTLEQVIATVDTRSWRSIAHAVGDACIAVGAAILVL